MQIDWTNFNTITSACGVSVCWHCTDDIGGNPWRIPYDYCKESGRFKVFGAVCSLECAKGYIWERKSPTYQYMLSLVDDMHRTVGGTKNILIAPAQCMLKKFGGSLDKDVSDSKQTYTRCNIHEIMQNLTPVYTQEVASNAIDHVEPLLLTAQNAGTDVSMCNLFNRYIHSLRPTSTTERHHDETCSAMQE